MEDDCLYQSQLVVLRERWRDAHALCVSLREDQTPDGSLLFSLFYGAAMEIMKYIEVGISRANEATPKRRKGWNDGKYSSYEVLSADDVRTKILIVTACTAREKLASLTREIEEKRRLIPKNPKIWKSVSLLFADE